MQPTIGKTIGKFTKKKNVIFLIQTDGHENASQEFPKGKGNDEIKKLVNEKTEKGWQFIFHGANIDAFSVGDTYGFDPKNVVTMKATSAGVGASYMTMNANTRCYRTQVLNDVDIDVNVKVKKK